ncbi:hypothetical protein ACJMK2_044064 [Sinanodonta woodiana]|uniref:C2H2-type domain-containing protein n=1 Tax=Sinanodonta woodiana TaxID=1069815 RepID=A0ABD3VYT1_SINWO
MSNEFVSVDHLQVLLCCRKCKGLFMTRDNHSKHVSECFGNPYKSPCQLYACERKYFLQVYNWTNKSNERSAFRLDKEHLQEDYTAGILSTDTPPTGVTSGGLSDENCASILSSIEDYPQLEYLDLAKKDPYVGGQNYSSQVNIRDPFLINATMKVPSQRLPIRVNDDFQASPSFQDTNYFNFPASTEDPTQLDYLDLARLDLFINNPPFQTQYGSLSLAASRQLDRFPADRYDNYSPVPIVSNSFNCNADRTGVTIETTVPLQEVLQDKSVKGPSDKLQCDFAKVNQTNTSTDNRELESLPGLLSKSDVSPKPERRKKEKKMHKLTSSYVTDNISDGKASCNQPSGHRKELDQTYAVDKSYKYKSKRIKTERKEPKIEDLGLYTGEIILDRTKYFCKNCDYKTYNHDHIRKHLEKHNQLSDEVKKCPFCSYTCCETLRMQIHLQKHANIALCPECGETFQEKAKLEDHVSEVHTGKYKFSCSQCLYTTNYRNGFEEHQRKHTGAFHSCDYEGCSFKTCYVRNLRVHKQQHEGVKKLVCAECDYVTDKSQLLKKHVIAIHKVKNFKCPHCNHTGATRSSVIGHIHRLHLKSKMYQCDQCDFKTSYNSGLRLHLMVHAGIKPFKCSLCDYQSNIVGKITRHIKRNHIDKQATVEKLDIPFTYDISKYKCTNCPNSVNVKVIDISKDSTTMDIDNSQPIPVDNKTCITKGDNSDEGFVIQENSKDLISKNQATDRIMETESNMISVSQGIESVNDHHQFAESADAVKNLTYSCGEIDLNRNSNSSSSCGIITNNLLLMFQCEHCSHIFNSQQMLQTHYNICNVVSSCNMSQNIHMS